jgi:diguanylate cyclase (GGDEF)-like protein
MDTARAFFYRLFFGRLADAPAPVRHRLLSTIPTTPASLILYCVTLILICVTAIVIDGAPWTWVWLGSSLLFVSWRVVHPLLRRRAGDEPPLVSIMVSSGLAFACFGLGCAACIATNNLTLTVMAISGIMGVVAGLGTRWAALPRAAITVMVVAVAGPVLVTLSRGGPHLIAGTIIALVVVAIASFAVENHKYLLAAVSAEEVSGRLARTDHLTGLANRIELMQQLQTRCKPVRIGSAAREQAFALLYIDLDGFKAVNDTHGHAMGDELLQRVAGCLRTSVGPDATIARIGGDEFIVLMEDADDLTARALSDEIIHAIAREHGLRAGTRVSVGCSIGVALSPSQGRDPEVLLARADAALYEVKHQGKGRSGIWRALGEA